MGNRKRNITPAKGTNSGKEKGSHIPSDGSIGSKTAFGGVQPVIHHKGFEDKSRKPVRPMEDDDFLLDGE